MCNDYDFMLASPEPATPVPTPEQIRVWHDEQNRDGYVDRCTLTDLADWCESIMARCLRERIACHTDLARTAIKIREVAEMRERCEAVGDGRR